MTNFNDLHDMTDDQLRAIVLETRNNPPANWDRATIYDTPRSYEACVLLGRRANLRMWTGNAA
jgi:hypothetical protein